jgi:hypothetical protein
MEEACAISNRIAPEHLEVSSREPHRWEPLLRHAGAIFLGAYTSESLGDYCAGPNHVLPTSGTARFSVAAGRVRLPETQQPDRGERSRARRRWAGPFAAVLAYGEGLQAHARAAEMRDCPAPKPCEPMIEALPGASLIRTRIRQDVQSMHAYAIQDSGRAWSSSTPWRTRTACRLIAGRELGARAWARWR